MLSSIQESYIKQMRKQGKRIRSSKDRYYLAILNWGVTDEGDLFWSILYASYLRYDVYDYETLIKLYIRFQRVPHIYLGIHDIYRDYFDKKKGTLTIEGLENLIKKIEK